METPLAPTCFQPTSDMMCPADCKCIRTPLGLHIWGWVWFKVCQKKVLRETFGFFLNVSLKQHFLQQAQNLPFERISEDFQVLCNGCPRNEEWPHTSNGGQELHYFCRQGNRNCDDFLLAQSSEQHTTLLLASNILSSENGAAPDSINKAFHALPSDYG